ncbi:MAG: tandem-95 repeat protein, partial [Phycisphaerae bacterium]|nr:tandem-95 repeat protein [Phycisphaerae bacterium]
MQHFVGEALCFSGYEMSSGFIVGSGNQQQVLSGIIIGNQTDMKKKKKDSQKKCQPFNNSTQSGSLKTNQDSPVGVEPLEPRIMLSATWIDADIGDSLDEPGDGNDIFEVADGNSDDWAEALANDNLFGKDSDDGDDFLEGNNGKGGNGNGNDGPDAVNDSFSTAEDTAITTANVLNNDADSDGDSLSISGFTQAANGSVADNGDGTFTYTPDANFNGTDSFTYTVDDGNGGTDTATVTVDVNAVNDAPTDLLVTSAQTNQALEVDGADAGVTVVGIYAPGSDTNIMEGEPELETLSDHNYFEHGSLGHTGYNYMGGHHWFADNDISISGLRGGTVEFSDGTTGEINAVSNGCGTTENAYIYYQAYDSDAEINVSEGAETGTQVASLSSNDPDAGDDVTYSIVGDSDQFEIVDNNIQVKDGAALDHETATSHDVTVRVTDADGLSHDKTLTINVGDANDAPDAVNDNFSTNENTAVTTDNLLANDTDQDGDSLSISGFTQADNGSVADNGDGTFTYTPNANFNGDDSFTYTVDDGNGGTDTATINVTVDAINEAPTIDPAQDQTVTEGTSVTLSVSANDAEGQNLTYSWEQVSGTSVTLANADTAEPTFDAPYLIGSENLEFEVTVSDGEHDVTEIVHVTVDADNDAPILSVGGDQVVAGGSTVTLDADVSVAPESIDFSDASVESYGGSGQDIDLEVNIEDDGDTIRMTGNGWKQIEMPYTITGDTILEFDFQSGSEGEIHGIGFDNDDGLNADHTFKLHGTQSWGIGDYDNYQGDEGEMQHYRIRVGDHFTGDFENLTFAMDHDVANADGESVFSNIKVFEEGQGDSDGESLTYTWEQVFGPAVTLNNDNTANPTFEAPQGELYGQDIGFKMTVSDGVHTVTDDVMISVEGNPDGILVDAGEDIVVDENNVVSLNVSTETAVDNISFSDASVES